ncbi:cobaltochelatase CobN subunit [Clostridium collagenovorans DSM 3089]|uniref:Cobaltochelatase CobN subunit n=1 Tax=Clostridium collagenovorans DSM 3089 TaxID=1121306 RepID=A0A1M5Y2F7_9CLOT|nr:cobaltochelatase subunit CobN [Clostridium collagenovorans]SHI06280.1 cobaltochelatase CobN subunit [Clostridium collagenovorans DSM 3089]
MFKIVFLTTMYDSNYIINKVSKKLKDEYGNLFSFRSFSTYYMDKDEEVLEEAFNEIESSNLVCYFAHGGVNKFKNFTEMMNIFGESKYFFMHSGMEDEAKELMRKSNMPEVIFNGMLRYFLNNGEENIENLIKFAANKLGSVDIEYGKLVFPQWEGIYYKKQILSKEEEKQFLNRIYEENKLVIGVLFYGNFMHKNNLKHVDCAIEEIEKQGVNVLAVFTHTSKDESIGAKGIQWSFENLFTFKERLLPEVIINFMGMSTSILSTPGDGNSVVDKSIFEQLDIPVIQAMTTYQSYETWKDSVQGIDAMSLTSNVYYPEFDGQIISVTTSYAEYESDDCGDRIVYKPIVERINKVVRLAENWIRLKRSKPEERKVAIIFHNMPPRNDMIGCAFGLDTPATVFNIVNDLKKEGVKLDYDFKNGDEIIYRIIEGVSNDKRWLTAEQALEKSIDIIDKNKYESWFKTLSSKVQNEMKRDWGKAPGEFLVFDEKMPIPGILNGNVFIGLQPSRGFIEKAEEAYHSTDLVPPHQYYGFYKWIKEDFGAHVIAHIGTHGTLEWLPGKEVGLSNECYPDIMIDDLPHLYPYSINITGEGIQVKRRSNGVILSHLIASMTLSEGYDDISELDDLIKQYYQAVIMDNGKMPIIKESIIELCIKNKYDLDLKIDKKYMEENFSEFMNKIHAYIEELKGNLIKDGLHIFGQCPKEERLNNLIFALLRIDSENIPSIGRAVAEIFNLDFNYMKDNGTEINFNAITNYMILDDITKLALEIINNFSLKDFDLCIIDECLNLTLSNHKGVLNNFINECNIDSQKSIKKLMKYISNVMLKKLYATEEELINFCKGARGEFVIPGKSGCPTRGNIDILPSGRNFYSIDPNCVPSRSSYIVGSSLASDLVTRYLKDEGKYPNQIMIIVYSGETMKTNGDDIAEILNLMGVKPIWLEGTDRVIGLEVIPLEELKRPRIDVTLRISGLFRDTFPNLIELIEEAVTLVSQLDEPEEMNFIKKNINEEIKELIEEGISLEEATEISGLRVFGCPPGTYGAGISQLIESKQWKDNDDLGNSYVNWSAHAYSKKLHGKKLENTFITRLSKTDVTVKNESSKEIDMLESDDYYNYHGGAIAAVKMAKGEYAKAYCGDASDPSDTKLKDINEQTAFIMRSRILNPKWFNGLKEHGYKGAQEISAMVDIAFGWDATSEVVEDWMYDKICDAYVLNKERREWINEVNKWAMHNMSERLLEANQRGMWNTTDKRLKELRKVYMNTEGELEDN